MNYDILIEDLHCLTDCFANKPDSCVQCVQCVTALLNDVVSNGVCLQGPGIQPMSESFTFEDYGYYEDQDQENLVIMETIKNVGKELAQMLLKLCYKLSNA